MKILTIDFDMIMEPSINIYNGLVDPNISYSNLFAGIGFMENPTADLTIYERLIDLLISIQCPRVAIESHEDAYNFIKEQKFTDVDLINIDHHHDIGYKSNLFLEYQPLDCGNWVGKGLLDKTIKSYTWINNDNSVAPEEIIANQIDNRFRTISFNNKNIKNYLQNVEYVILCKSAAWVPNLYLPLFDLMKKF